ncbi:MAG: lamin tail domain-containing protein [Schleiferiaceae bacterium]
MKQIYTLILAVLGLSAAATNHQIQVGSNFFSPAYVSVSPGDTVTWTQVSGSHNVNGSLTTFPSNPAGFSSGAVAGGTWTYSFVFTTPGVYSYQCDPHAAMGMVGKVNVVTLTPGAIAFTGITSDAPDTYQFVALRAIPGGTVLKFTDISWGATNDWYNAGLTTGELDTVVYVAPAAGLAPGTVVSLYDDGNGGTAVLGGGVASGVLGGISASGDHVFAFQGPKAYPAFIAAVGNAPFITSGNTLSTSSYLPASLTLGQNAMAIASAHIDNGFYQCDSAVTSGTEAAVRAAIYDQANWNTNNALISLSNWPSCTYTVGAPSTACADLFISEYLEGSSNNKALEIYNPTSAPINLSAYSLKAYNNGGLAVSNSLQLPNKTLAAYDVYVVANPTANAAILAASDTTSTVTFFNGDDAVVLFKNADTLDIIGIVGNDPGTNWPVGTGATSEFTLVRKSAVNQGQLNWTVGATEWDVYPQNTTSYLGSHSSVCGGGTPPATSLRPIGSLRGVDANGVADSLGAVVAVTGVVTSIDFDGNTGYSFFVQDATGGINVFKSADLTSYTSPMRGDSLYVHGSIDQYNGLTELVPDSIAVWGTNKPLPTPLVITTMDETNEGELVRMNSMTATTWPATWTGSGQNATISDGTNSFTLRIDADCNLFGKPQPSGLFDVLGLVGQFDNSSPYTSGYQLFPRDTNDIIPVVATSPTVRFVGGSATVLEGNVSHTVKMSVQPHLMTAGSVTVTATPGTGFVYGSDATTTPAVSGGTFTVNVPAMADTVSFVVNVLDDQIIEGNENLLFTLSAASTGLAIGAPSTFTFTIADNDVYIPTYTIPQVKGVNASFVPDSNGVMCKLQGTVLGVNTQTFASTGNVAFTIHDGSVGFGVFGPGTSNLGYTVNEGDVVRIIGVIGHFNGLAQINADSIVVLSTNAALPTPVVITALDESTESQLIRMNDVTVVNPTQWTNAGSGFTVDVTDGVNTIQLRIDADVADVYNAPCPVGTFDVVGIGGQFDNSAPHNSGYQFLPRYLADFIYPVPVTYDLAITEIMANSNDANGAVSGDWFEVTNYGSTSVDLAGFSWDDNSYAAGTVVFPAVTLAPGEALVVAQIDAANEAAFRSTWNLGPWVQVLVNEDFTVGQPAFSANGDGVALFDTSATPIEICRAEYPTALAGFSAEFDTACTYLGNASVGVRGAYTSTGGDVGSPGNQSVGLEERGLIVRLQPNPTTGLVQLQLPGVANYVITVRNLNGQILGQQQLRTASAEINLSGLARGMYLVEVVSEVGQSTQRIVLQ